LFEEIITQERSQLGHTVAEAPTIKRRLHRLPCVQASLLG
jgi:hypothetical protein